MPTRPPNVVIPKPRIERATEQVARILRQWILQLAGHSNLALPPIEQLARQLGTSISMTRAAVQMLVYEGILVVKPGRHGGVFISQPSEDKLAHDLTVILASRRVALEDVLEARAHLESLCAGLACSRADDEALKLLRSLVSEVEENCQHGSNNEEFHLAVAQASGNRTLATLVAALRLLIRGLDSKATLLASDRGIELKKESLRAHRAILCAIEARDRLKAQELMWRHILGFWGRPEVQALLAKVATVDGLFRQDLEVQR